MKIWNTFQLWLCFTGRFNIHQELIAAVLYRVYSFGMTPVMFYVNVVFSLQGLFLAAKFLITWHISGSWLAGVLTTGLATNSIHFCFLFVKKYGRGKTIFSFVPPSNSLVSVSDP